MVGLKGNHFRKAGALISKAEAKGTLDALKKEAGELGKAVSAATGKGTLAAGEKSLEELLAGATRWQKFNYHLGNSGVYRFAKKTGLAAALVGGTVALGVIASRMGSKRRYRPEDNIDQAQADLAALQASMPMGPADGRAPNEWQNKMRPGAAAQVAAQPAMTAVAPESVQDLGAPTPSR